MWERAVLRSGARRACLANPNLQTLSYGHRGPPRPVVNGVLRTPNRVVNLRPKAKQ